MATNLEFALKIRALADGLDDIAAMTRELESLAEAGEREIPDGTEPLRAGATETTEALRETADAAETVGESAAGSTGGVDQMRDALARVAVAGASLGAIAATLKGASDEARNYETRFAKLEAVIRATGGAAGVSAEEIRGLSTELAEATLGSVAEFENAAAALLTFKSISGEAFGQALELSKDLAEVMGGDAKSAAMQLGKALEDPERGLTALTRAGVSFSDAEQEIIKGLVESGRLFEAQGLILEKVAGQVGGVARAMADGTLDGALDTLSLRFEALRKSTGDAINPALIELTNQLSGLLETLAENLDTVAAVAKVAGSAVLAAFALKTAGAVKLTTVQVVALSSALARIPAQANAAAASLTRLQKGVGLVGAAFVGWQIGTQLKEQFLEVELAGIALANGLTKAAARAQAAWEMAKAPFTDDTISDAYDRLQQKLREIDDDYGALADAAIAARHATEEAADGQAQAVEAAGAAVRGLAKDLEGLDGAQLVQLADDWVTLARESEAAASDMVAALGEVTQAQAAEWEALAVAADTARADMVAALEAVSGELDKLNTGQLQAFSDTVRQAFAEGRLEAEAFARINDEILNASFDRLGINAAAALGKISPAAEDAIAAVDGIVTALDNARVESERSALVIEQALTKAFDVADSLPALDALEARLKKLAAEGKLSAEGVARLGEEVQKARARIEQATPGVTRVTQALERNAAEAEAAAKKMAELREEYERLMQAGDLQGAAAVQQQMSALRQETEQTGKALEDVGESGRDAKDGLEDAGEGGKKAAEGAEDAEQATEKLGNSINDTTMIARLYAAQIKQLKEEIAGYSEAALRAVEAAYDSAAGFSDAARRIEALTANAQELIAEDALGGVDQVFAEAKDEAAALRAELEEMQSFERIFGAGLAFAGLRRYIASLQEMKVALAEAKARLAELDVEVAAFDETVAAGTLSLREQERELARLVARAEELGSQQLTGLRAALDDVRRKMQDVAESARDTLGQLQDELDEIEGRYVAIERRRIAARRADIQAQLVEARASGDQEAVKLLTEALRALEQIEKARLDEAKARERETRERRREETSGAARPGGGEPGPGGRGTTSVTSHMPIHIHGITDPVKLAPMLEAELRKLAKLRN